MDNMIDIAVFNARHEKAYKAIDAAKRMIFVTFQKEGIHKFPAASGAPFRTGAEDDVSFLQYEHRHMFHFKVSIQVNHNDRDIEFIQFKRWCESLYNNSILKLEYQSCEMIADGLYRQIAQKYPDRAVTIEVAEDGENGCIIQY